MDAQVNFKGRNFDANYFQGRKSPFFLRYDAIFARLCHKLKFRKSLKILLKYKKRGRILDMGCAYGIFANWFQKRGFEVVGCDISQFAIRKGKRISPKLKLVINDVENGINFKDSSFDIIIAFEILEHCKNLRGILREMRRILKEDGIACITVPVLEYSSPERDETHFWYLRTSDWIKIFEKNGFSVLEVQNYLKSLSKLLPNICSNFFICKKS